MRIGFIGLGNMGGQQARLLAESSNDLVVYDTSADALKSFDGKALLGGSPAEVGTKADVIGVCVRDDRQVREVLEGPQGLLGGLMPGAIVLIHSTVNPATILALADKVKNAGGTLIDAAVTRTELQGSGRFVYTMTGGEAETTERVRPILEAFSTEIIHVGPLGSAMALKITNNFVVWSEIVIARQAFRLAEAGGVKDEQLRAVMLRNGNLTPVMKSFIEGQRRQSESPSAEYDALMKSQGFIGEKDLDLAVDLAQTLDVPLPGARHARELVYATLNAPWK